MLRFHVAVTTMQQLDFPIPIQKKTMNEVMLELFWTCTKANKRDPATNKSYMHLQNLFSFPACPQIR
jgi:hypothetical protein